MTKVQLALSVMNSGQCFVIGPRGKRNINRDRHESIILADLTCKASEIGTRSILGKLERSISNSDSGATDTVERSNGFVNTELTHTKKKKSLII